MVFPCSGAAAAAVILLSAIPIAFLVALERSKSSTQSYEYRSGGWLRECAKWDHENSRFIVSRFEGGIGQISVPAVLLPGTALQEEPLLADPAVAGNASLGLTIDRRRRRLLVVVADVLGGRYGAVAAYDMSTWQRQFLTHLAGADERSLADDVAVDEAGNAYVTDAKACRIWKVGLEGNLVGVIKDPIFTQREAWYHNLIGLNGIVYHPSGFLLVIHTSSGCLFKIKLGTAEAAIGKIELEDGSLIMGDGLELLSPTRLVVAGTPARLVESGDGWSTASIVGRYLGPVHRVATAATAKDGKAYMSYALGWTFPKRTHVITEAVFSPLL